MFDLVSKFLRLVRQLYPTGRAFKLPSGGELEKLHQALNESIQQAYEDSISTLDSILPDNAKFLEDDATDWERRLGLINGEGKDLEDRKKAILQKMNQPGRARAQSHFLYLQLQLQTAGFDVFVHENIFPVYPSGLGPRTAVEVANDFAPGSADQIFEFSQHGNHQHGFVQSSSYNNLVANFLDPKDDNLYSLSTDFRSTFFIGGEALGSFADVPKNRESEFRQLILKVKPVPNIGFLFINYTT